MHTVCVYRRQGNTAGGWSSQTKDVSPQRHFFGVPTNTCLHSHFYKEVIRLNLGCQLDGLLNWQRGIPLGGAEKVTPLGGAVKVFPGRINWRGEALPQSRQHLGSAKTAKTLLLLCWLQCSVTNRISISPPSGLRGLHIRRNRKTVRAKGGYNDLLCLLLCIYIHI